ncbi:MAG: LamG domain-containing protein [Myxococcaceae bacterium]
MLTRSIAAVVAVITLHVASVAFAATSPRASPSPFGGNGHNVTFDGRLFIVRQTPGWEATIFRPQSVNASGGFPDVSQAFAPFTEILPEQSNENALALCEETPQPTNCNQDGSANGGGAYACYNLTVIDSDALAPAPTNVMRARKLRVIVSNPATANAAIDSFTWTQSTPTPLATTLRGIEPSITKDGKLLIWQGVPQNNGQGDTVVYSVNSTPCGLTGWSAPKSITAMAYDSLVVGKYQLAEKPLRGADGTAFANNQVFYGAYPWIFPDGEALNFTATTMPCRTQPPNEDPPGCGPRRNALSVIGYPTNWQLSHIDGAVNPDRENQVRLFFSSPGPNTFNTVPVTTGLDVWPFFGSNTQNYTEIVFDDALDGKYAGLWHMNELVTNAGVFDLARTPDSSGYSNTGRLMGASALPPANNGQLGKAVLLDGASGRVEVAHASSLNPVNAITIEMWLKPASDPDCDATNNYRVLLEKGTIATGSYSVVLEENRDLQARVRVAGGTEYALAAGTQLPVGQWSKIAVEYDGATGTMAFWVNGVETNRAVHPAALLSGTTDKLTIGGPDGIHASCPMNGDGEFHGEIDEVAISRVWRYGTPPGTVVVVDAGTPDAGSPVADAGTPVVPDAGTTPEVDAGSSEQPDSGVVDPGGSDDAGTIASGGGGGSGGTGGGSGGTDQPASVTTHQSNEAVGSFGCSTGGAPMGVLALLIAARLLSDARRRRREE